ncbi:MAG TPA: MMPL family transporter [Bacteroidales bacterium]|nr:MMPL family transporter [Bacteroidales bacterium]
MWTSIARFILRNRIALLVVLGVITIFMGWQLPQLKMDYHYASMLSDSDPVHLDNQEFKATFGEEGNAIFIGINDDKFFELSHFKQLYLLCDSLKKIEYVKAVLGVQQAVNIKQVTLETDKGLSRQFEIYPLFPDSIATQQQLDSLKQVFYSLPFYSGLLTNKAKTVFLISVTLQNEILNMPQRLITVQQVEETLLGFSQKNNIEVHISGHPYIRSQMMMLIKSEIRIFIILAALMSIIILFVFFRSFKVLGVSILLVGTGVVWAMGLMSLLQFKITVLTSMIPPLLIVIGIPNAVYLLNKYHSELKKHSNKILALQRTIRKTGNAIFLSNLTTAVGFAAFTVTNSRILSEFGAIASIGILFIFVLAIIIIPSVFSLWKIPSERYTKHLENLFVKKILVHIQRIATYKRKQLFIISVATLLLGIGGIFFIKQTGYIMDDVPHHARMYKDLKFLESTFNGVSPLEIMIKTKDSLSGQQFIYQIQKIDSLQTALSHYSELSRSVSVADAVKFLHQSYARGKTENYCLPDNPKTFEIIFKRLPTNLSFNESFIKSFIDSTKTVTRVSLNIEDIGTYRMKKLLPEIQQHIDRYFPPNEYHTVITGSTILYFTGTTYLIKNLFGSLAMAFVIIGFLLFWMFKSVKITLLSLVPNVIPMIITAGVMGWAGIPLKPSTILVFTIAFGISVDGTIHFLNKYRYELLDNNRNMGIAVNNAIFETGISMTYTYIILFFGFIIFSISDFGGTQALGILVSLALLVAMCSNLIILPSLLLSLEKIYNRKAISKSSVQNIEAEGKSKPKEGANENHDKLK